MKNRARGFSLVEVILSLTTVGISLLMLTRIVTASGAGSSTAHRLSEAQQRAQQILENMRAAPPKVIFSCLAATPAASWPQCETLCRQLLGVAATADRCAFSTLPAARDSTGQQYALDTTISSVSAPPTMRNTMLAQVSIGWNDDDQPITPYRHHVTLKAMLYSP